MKDAVRSERDVPWPNGWRSFLFDVTIALLATGAELVQVTTSRGAASLPAIAVTMVAGGTLVIRRWAPVVTLATTIAAAVAVVALDGEPAGAAVLVALYTTASVCERRVSLAALVPTVLIAAVLSAVTSDAEGREASAPFGAILAAVMVVGVWGLGAYAQTRRRYLRELEERAARTAREREQLTRIAVHEERAAIARELHDIVAHSVSVMLVGVRGARDVLRTAPEVADATLARVETSGEQSLAELRRILALLREPAQGVESRPQPSLADLDELVAGYRAAELPARLEILGRPQPLPGGVELSVYRIVEEALTNALKHSRPSRVTVTLSFRRSRLEVEIVDDGSSAVDDAMAVRHGLVGMQERVALLGGELETGPRVGGGFRVAAWLPVGGDT